MSITAPTYDPTSTAAALAQKYIQPLQDTLTAQSQNAQATSTGLSKLRSAISTYQAALASLTGLNKTLFARSATLSDTTLGSATASATAMAGTYSMFVQQIATATQVVYKGLSATGYTPSTDPATSTMTINVGAAHFDVQLDTANTDTDPTNLSVRELADAINKASGNTLVTAAVMTAPDGTKQLALTAKNTGAGAISMTFGAGVDANLASSTGGLGNGNQTVLVAGQNAVAWLNASYDTSTTPPTLTGTRVEQASNTFTNIDGVKATFTKAQAAGADPVKITVTTDSDTTRKNVQSYIDAFNTLKATVDGLVDPGDPDKGVAAGPFAHDAGMRALRDRLAELVRPASGAGAGLLAYGITGTKAGGLVLDPLNLDLLNRRLAIDPSGLDTLVGTASLSTNTGVSGALNTFLNTWSNGVDGQLKQRGDVNDKLQKDLTRRQTDLSAKYDSAYKRYLKQFTDLQTLQSRMNSNQSMFDALFGNKPST